MGKLGMHTWTQQDEDLLNRIMELTYYFNTFTQFCSICNIDQTNFSRFRHRTHGIGDIYLRRIANGCNVNFLWLKTGEGEKYTNSDHTIQMNTERHREPTLDLDSDDIKGKVSADDDVRLRIISLMYADEDEKQFAHRCDLNPSQFFDYINKKRSIKPVHIKRIADVCNVNTTWIITGKGDKYIKKIPSVKSLPSQSEVGDSVVDYSHAESTISNADDQYLRILSLKYEGESDRAFAKRCNIDPQRFSAYIKKKKNIGSIYIRRIALACNVNPAWIIDGVSEKSMTTISYPEKPLIASSNSDSPLKIYESVPSESFKKLFLEKYPDRDAIVKYVCEAIGKEDVKLCDLTDAYLAKINDTILKRVSTGTARTYFAIIKAFINQYKDAIPCTSYTNELSTEEIPSENVYLTEAEIDILEYYLKKLENKNSNKVKDNTEKDVLHAFLAECYGGVRCYELMARKEIGTIMLPFHPQLREHLDYQAVKTHQTATKNCVIKRVCQECGINETTTIFYHGKKLTKPKYEFVGCHTAKRSFATNLFLRNVPLSVIAQMMNHGDNIAKTKHYIMSEGNEMDAPLRTGVTSRYAADLLPPKRKMTFWEFKIACTEIFNAFKEHSTMYDLRVWDNLPYDILKERKCWYCCVRLSEEVQMMITFDPEDEDEKPFVCWYDYQLATTTYGHWAFATLEEAMLFCCNEPHVNYRTYKRDKYILYRDTKHFDGTPMWQIFCNLSILTAVDFVKKNYDNIPDGIWELKNCNEFRKRNEGTTEYKFEIKSGRKNTAPFSWSAQSEYPLWIYEFNHKEYYE